MNIKNIFHIPAEGDFLKQLAEGVVARYGTDPLTLSQITILLPNRRSARALSKAFLAVLGCKAALLPIMRGIGDVEEEELHVHADAALDIPPAIAPQERRLLLTKLVKEYGMQQNPYGIGDHHALQLAIELGHFIDEVEREQLSWDQLPNIVPAELSAHWQTSLGFLYELPKRWQEELTKRGAVDTWRRKNLLMQKQVEQWEKSPPTHPVIAAGSTGSIPATAQLLKAIASMKQGAVVLSALDTGIDEASWNILQEDHPQYALKQLIKTIGVDRLKIPEWVSGSKDISARGELMREVMRPTETIGAWQTLQSLAPKATRDFMVVETETQEEEAAVIAVQLRQVLETEGKTACLVTTDRALARRVSSLMRVWDVVVDDSAGVPLLLTTPMVFVRLVAEAVQAQFAPMEMLALFKHPLCSAGQSAAAFRAEVRACEVALLRGPRVVGGLAGMIALLEEQKLPALAKWLERIHTLALSFSELFKEDHAPLKALLHAHLALAENLAATDTESGVMRLWGSEEGERAWEFLQALNASAPAFTRAEVCNYTKLLETLFAGAIYRKAYGQHPALTILSPIEARLLSFDMMILAGMNQGSWPVLESSAWMSRPMASQFGMNGSEIKLGLSAHDFVSFCFAREVMITRAAKVEGTPTMPSMWLMRLEVVLKKLGLKEQVYNGESLVNAAREYFTPKSEGMHGIAPPVANPPLGTRPHSIYATQFETLMRNPYLYYVRHLLKLRPLDTIDSEADAADLGSLIHAVIDSYTKQANIKPPASVGEGEVLFLQLAAEAFSRFEARPSIHTLWWPRIEAIAHWFVAYDTETRSTGRSIHSEILGEAEIKTEAGKTVELKAKADRLEIGKDGNVTLIDFKTGGLPTRADIQQGFSPQLLLEGLILAHAGFGTAVHGVPAEMIYYRLGNAFTSGDSVKAESGVANIQPEIVKILSAYLDEAHPYYARPFKDKSKNIKELDYIQRLDEWISPKSENNK